jgi:hypothetical protein
LGRTCEYAGTSKDVVEGERFAEEAHGEKLQKTHCSRAQGRRSILPRTQSPRIKDPGAPSGSPGCRPCLPRRWRQPAINWRNERSSTDQPAWPSSSCCWEPLSRCSPGWRTPSGSGWTTPVAECSATPRRRRTCPTRTSCAAPMRAAHRLHRPPQRHSLRVTAAPVAAVPRRDEQLEARKRQAEQAEKAKEQAEQTRIAKIRQDNCDRATRARTTLASGIRVSTTNAKGEMEIMDDRARAAETQRLDRHRGAGLRSDAGRSVTGLAPGRRLGEQARAASALRDETLPPGHFRVHPQASADLQPVAVPQDVGVAPLRPQIAQRHASARISGKRCSQPRASKAWSTVTPVGRFKRPPEHLSRRTRIQQGDLHPAQALRSGAVHLIGTLDKRVHQAGSNLVENRAHQFGQCRTGKTVAQIESHLAGALASIAQWLNIPVPSSWENGPSTRFRCTCDPRHGCCATVA